MAENKLASPKSILIFVIILFVLIASLSVASYLSSVKKTPPVIVQPTEEPTVTPKLEPTDQNSVNDNNYLFSARYKDFNDGKHLLFIAITKVDTNQIIKSKEIDTVDPVRQMENSSVQYNYLTRDIFYSTDGISGIGPRVGTNCINKDGTCDFRIFKINIDNNTPIKLFEEKDRPPNQWVLNKVDNYLYLYDNRDILLIKKIDIDKGTIETIINQPNTQHLYFSKIQITKNGKELYASCNNTAPEKPSDVYIKYLCSIDLISNKLTTSLMPKDASQYNSMFPDKPLPVISSPSSDDSYTDSELYQE